MSNGQKESAKVPKVQSQNFETYKTDRANFIRAVLNAGKTDEEIEYV